MDSEQNVESEAPEADSWPRRVSAAVVFVGCGLFTAATAWGLFELLFWLFPRLRPPNWPY